MGSVASFYLGRLWSIPTVCLDVISLVARSCGYERGQIEQRAVHEFAVHVATQRGLAKRIHHRHPPRAQPVALMRVRHCRRPRLPPEALHRSGTLSRAGTPRWRTREGKRPHRLTMPREAMPARLSSFRLLAMASPPWMLIGSSWYDSIRVESLVTNGVSRLQTL